MFLYWLLVALSALAPAVSHAQSVCTDPECEKLNDRNDPYYYNLLETALLNDSSNLYKLQRTLFPTRGDPRVANKVHVFLNITVNRLENNFCEWSSSEKLTLNNKHWWYRSYTWHAQDESSLDAIADRVLSTATMHAGIIALAKAFGTSRHTYLDQYFKYFDELWQHSVFLAIRLDYLKCNPEEDDTEYVTCYLLSWCKQYAIAQGKPDTWDESNRGEVDVFEYFQSESASLDRLILAIFVLLNISVMLVALRVTPGLYSKIVDRLAEETRSNEFYRMFYWGGATVLLLVVIVLFLADVVVLCMLPMEEYYKYYFSITNYIMFKEFKTTWGIVVVLKVVIAVMEIGICTLTCNRNRKGIDFPFSCFTNIYCCCCFCCKCCSRNVKCQAVQTLALWAIVSFVQHLAMSVVPIFFIVILYPGEGFSILAMCLAALFCIIMLVSHVLYMGHAYRARANRRNSVATFMVQILLIVSLLGVVIGIILLYIKLLGDGASFNGLGGLFVSLLPLVALSMIGWFVKKKLLPSSSASTPQTGDVNQEARDTAAADEQIPLIA